MIKALVVDDNDQLIELYREAGSNYGIEIKHAECLSKARTILNDDSFNFVFLDIKLRNECGLDLIEEIKNINSKTKIIIITGYNEYEYFKKAFESGADNFISKPISINLIKSIFRTAENSCKQDNNICLSGNLKFLISIVKLLNSDSGFSAIITQLTEEIMNYISYKDGIFLKFNSKEPCFFSLPVISEKHSPEIKYLNQIADKINSLLLIGEVEAAIEQIQLSLKNNLHKFKQVMVIPLIRKYNLFGLFIFKEKTERDFTLFNKDYLDLVIQNIGIAFEKDLLLNKLKEELEIKEMLERQLFESGKLAAIGELAAGISHEINNPLGIISAFAQLILRKDYIEKPDRELLEKIVSESLKASEIILRVLNYSRKKPVYQGISIHNVIKNSVFLIQEYFSDLGIRIYLDFNAEKDIIYGNIIDFQEIFINFLTNAKDAIVKNGEIRISTENKILKNKEFIKITISDTGSGIPEEKLSRIFEPFYTTKEVGKGTGLGLSINFKIIESYNGLIDVETKAGTGTKFFIYFQAKGGDCEKKNISG